MKRILFIAIFALVCIGDRAQTLLSRSYDASPDVSYTVFDPQKDTIYYWTVRKAEQAKMIETFSLKFRRRNELIESLKFILSLENQEIGRTYLLDATLGKNTITTGKIEGFLILPTEVGVTICNEKGLLPSCIFYSFDTIAKILKGLGVKVATLKEKERNERRNNPHLDDAYKY